MKQIVANDIENYSRPEQALKRAHASWISGETSCQTTSVPTRVFILGDPQAPIQQIFSHLDANGLLTKEGWIDPTSGIICVGDYFDFPSSDPYNAGFEGILFLSWLSAHPASQVGILMGNHDAERVMSLSGVAFDSYNESLKAYGELSRIQGKNNRITFLDTWKQKSPKYPPLVAAHDYKSYHPEQGPLVRRLLLQGRMCLAACGTDASGQSVVITHAGITNREVSILDTSFEAHNLASQLNDFLRKAVDVVRSSWESGGEAMLDLRPLYFPWEMTRPNGGCLIHRPDARESVTDRYEDLGLTAPVAPRSVLPDKFLLPGLNQIIGHTVASDRLVRWLEPNVTHEAKISGPGTILALFRGPNNHAFLGTATEMGESHSSVQFVDMAMCKTEPGTIQMMRITEAITP